MPSRRVTVRQAPCPNCNLLTPAWKSHCIHCDCEWRRSDQQGIGQHLDPTDNQDRSHSVSDARNGHF